MDPQDQQNAQDEDMMDDGPEFQDEYATSSQGSSSHTSTLTWINWFTSLPGHDFYCQVHEDYIEDDFNLTGLQAQVPFWKQALEMVLDVEPEEDSNTIPDISIIESSSELLYGLVHQRFILTKAGLAMMAERYEQAGFGRCSRVFCQGYALLPCGRADTPGVDTVKLFCPNCQDIYSTPSSKYANVDGAFFGTTFPTLFFHTYPEFLPMPFKGSSSTAAPGANPTPDDLEKILETGQVGGSQSNSAASGPDGLVNPNEYGGQRTPHTQVYIPRIYGFKVSERARSGPRMSWLRDRPETPEELQKVDWKGRWIGEAEASQTGPEMAMGVMKQGESTALFEEDDD